MGPAWEEFRKMSDSEDLLWTLAEGKEKGNLDIRCVCENFCGVPENEVTVLHASGDDALRAVRFHAPPR
jgi:hypothetical protein